MGATTISSSYNVSVIPHLPYFKTSRYRVATLIELAEIKPGEHFADLGSGDGRIAIAAAMAHAQVIGFELNPELITQSQTEIQKLHLTNRIVILQQNFWEIDLSQFDIVAIYPMPDIMDSLEKKLLDELRPGTRVLLNYYQFPQWKFEKTRDHIYLYRKS